MNITSTCIRRFWAALALVVGLGMIAVPSQLRAQFDERNSGTTYVIAFPDTTTNTFDSRFPNRMADTIALFIYSPVDNEVDINSPNGYQNKVRPRARQFEIVYLNSSKNRAASPIAFQSNTVTNTTFRLEAKFPIIVYCYYVTKFGGEAFTPIPVESWGLEYYAAGHPGEVMADVTPGGETTYQSKNKQGPAEVLVVAAFDNTKVTLTAGPKTIFLNYPLLSVTLNAGQCYQVQTYVDTLSANQGGLQAEIAGVYVSSDKPVGVVSGNSRAQLNPNEQAGLARNSFKNMAIEWIAPTEQHGKTFVYLPTWDNRRITGQPGEKIEEKRAGEFVRVYGTSLGRTNGTVNDGGITSNFGMNNQEVWQDRVGSPAPRVYVTDTASQAFQSCMATVIFDGTTGSVGFLGAKYRSYGTYMVEMTPKEQWTTFAPYYSSPHPSQMEHFVNIVTDSVNKLKIFKEDGNRVVFNRGAIAGTPLIWGTMNVTPGLDHWFDGTKDSAKFSAFVYGLWQGYELYRPGKTKKKDDGGSELAGGGRRGDNLLHPSEYEENTAVAYGYPLAPSRIVLRPSDSIIIDTSQTCFELSIRVRAINDHPVGFRSISLDPTSIVNAKLLFIDPDKASDVIGKSEARLKVVPIDPLKDASAVVIIKDRTGKIWRVVYKYEAERVVLSPEAIVDFGPITQNECKDTVVTITNPLKKVVQVKDIKVYFGNQAFSVASTNPTPLPVDLPAGGSMKVTVRFCPKIENQLYTDTLRAILGCTEVKLPLRGETVKPCIQVDDLNFGTFILGTDGPKTLPLDICNTGRGLIRFNNPSGGNVLTWLLQNFSVPQATIDNLKNNVVLGPNECVTIDVTFTPTQLGIARTVAKFWSTADCTRDTSIWVANVTRPGPQITGYNWNKRWLTVDPLNCTKNPTPYYEWTIEAINTGNSDFQVKSIELVGPDAAAGIFVLDSTDAAQMINVGQLVRPINPVDSLPKLFQKVRFYPREERAYSCDVVLVTLSGDTARNILEGIGIEPHTAITGFDYGIQFFRPGLTTPTTLTVSALPTRALTVTDIVTNDPANFTINKAGLLPFTLQPGETKDIPVDFTPQAPGKLTASIRVIGNHSGCDNDSNLLVGETYVLGATATPWTFGSPLTCNDEVGSISVTNTSSVPVWLSGFRLAGPDASLFTLVNFTPQVIPANATISFLVRYAPTTPTAGGAQYTAQVTWDVQNEARDSTIASPVSDLKGEAHNLVATADVANNYATYPGSRLAVPMTIDKDLSEAKIDKLYITMFYYNKGMMNLRNFATMTNGSLLAGWTPTPGFDERPGYFAVEFTAPPGAFLTGTGPLLNMDYLTFLGSSDTSAINFTVEAIGKPCVTINNDPGFARIDSLCGLNFRLIEPLSANSYTLDPNKPNPFNPTTDITFEIGLDGPTTLVIYNALGEPVAKLVDTHLNPGKYSVTWNAAGYPSGLYYYRLESGTWSRTETMILKK